MAKSKVYELAIKINGKLDSSLKKACAAAAQNLETVGNAAKTAGKVVAGASAAIVGATATMEPQPLMQRRNTRPNLPISPPC